MTSEEPPQRRSKATTKSAERVRVICIRNVDFCVYDDKVPIAIYSKKVDAESHRQRLLRQQSDAN
jgi:hypothetical protein